MQGQNIRDSNEAFAARGSRTIARRFLAAICLIFLGSCAQWTKLAENHTIDGKNPNGVVIVSLTFEGGVQFIVFALDYRRIGSDVAETMRSDVSLAQPDVESGGRRGWLFPRELPPGDYEFYKWRGEASGRVFWSPTDFSNRFTVTAGRATYIGNLNVRTFRNQYQVQVRDERERDTQAFLSRHPRIKKEQIAYEIMSDDMNRPKPRKLQLDDLKDLLPDTAR